MTVGNGGPVAITGGGGFIGQAVTRSLAVSGRSLRVLVGPPGTPFTTPHGIDAHFGDITDASALAPVLDGCEVVVHLAGPPSVAQSFTQPAQFARAHVVGLAVLFEVLPETVRRVVYVSSAEVYGRQVTSPVSECAPCAPTSPYGVAKFAAEQLVHVLAPSRAVDAVILRPFSVYGPGARPDSVLMSVIAQAMTENRVAVRALDVRRDYCAVSDVADAVTRGALAPLPEGTHTLNVAAGVGTSVLELAEKALAIVGRDVPIVQTVAGDRPTSADIRELVADRRLIVELLDWSPTTSLDDGMRQLIGSMS